MTPAMLRTNPRSSPSHGVAARACAPLTMVLNGRFRGGAITRGYGNPAAFVHAIQIEIAQAAYMDETDPQRYDEAAAGPIRNFLRASVEALS